MLMLNDVRDFVGGTFPSTVNKHYQWILTPAVTQNNDNDVVLGLVYTPPKVKLPGNFGYLSEFTETPEPIHIELISLRQAAEYISRLNTEIMESPELVSEYLINTLVGRVIGRLMEPGIDEYPEYPFIFELSGTTRGDQGVETLRYFIRDMYYFLFSICKSVH